MTAVTVLTGALLVGGALTAPFASASVRGGDGSGAGLVQRWLSWYSHRSGHASQPAPWPAAGPASWPTGWPAQPGVAGLGAAPGTAAAPPSAPAPATASAPATAAAPATGAPARGGSCADVEVVFARGTGDLPGLGVLGTPLVSAIRSALPGRTVNAYGVNYAAEASQASAGPGATDMSRHVRTVAAACPGTRFVIGGYSQGATVTDIAIGIPFGTSTGEAIPAGLASRVAAVVVFGNPLGIMHQTITQRSPVYGPKAKEFCSVGDPICGNGANSMAHLQYMTDGSVQQAAQFAAGKVTGA
ncbi:cutinase family protein [Dactylosporangium sp. CA-139066]|uniref:cutinase family protein n=1 Tax=Dactylosporangium sp. CA-139066 TaxID=3239930 RepID=UPI003D8B6974